MKPEQYTMVVTIPVGPSDMGAEQECSITFKFTPGGVFRMYRRNGDPADPPDPPEVQFVKAEPYLFGKPSPFGGAYADLEMSALQQTASDWLETDAGFEAAQDHVDNLPCKDDE